MSKGPSEETADARGDLAVWLDNYTAGRVDRGRMQASFLEICRSNPEAPWDALALLDQYQRRGRVDAALARTLKSDIAQLVFGVVNQSEEDEAPLSEDPSTDPVPPVTETTGTRWRRMAAEKEEAPPPASADPTFVDPMQLVREAPLTRPPPSIRHPHATDAAGILRDRYELLTVLGRDTGGVVYKAFDRHRAHLDPAVQCVALRVFQTSFRDSPRALAELEHQFHAAQSLAHPNIAKVIDLDRDGSQYFLVMELVEGESLSSLLQRLDHHAMPNEQALAILGSIGAGLTYAHSRGVVHADLHPGAVVIAGNGEIKLMDVGFGRREPVESRREPWISDPSLGVRSPAASLAYASEERVNGESPTPVDDVYSLGCIAYELLAGHHPFGGRSAPLARAHGRAPQRIPGLTSRQWSALQTALKWSHADRKIDAAELVSALGANAGPVLVPPRSIAGAPVRRSYGRFGAAALALLLVAGAAAAFWFNRESLPPISNPLPQLQTAEETPPATTEVIPDPAPLPQAQPPVASTPDPTPAVAADPVTQPAPTQATAPKVVQATPAAAPPDDASTTQSAPAQAAAPVAEAGGGGMPRVSFTQDRYEAMESDGSVKLTVRRSGSVRRPVTFQWMLLPASAKAGDDFADIGPGSETIPAGVRTATITIPLVSDAVPENTELFAVEISLAEGEVELGAIARATVLVIDDD